MDDEYGEYEEQEMQPARINWADFVFSALVPLRGFFDGCTGGVRNLMSALAMHSAYIGEKQEFARDAGRSIEALSRGED